MSGCRSEAAKLLLILRPATAKRSRVFVSSHSNEALQATSPEMLAPPVTLTSLPRYHGNRMMPLPQHSSPVMRVRFVRWNLQTAIL